MFPCRCSRCHPVLSSAAALAAPATPQLMGDRLRAGELQQLEADLSTALRYGTAGRPGRFALGATQFLRTIEGMAQSMYRHGLEAPQSVEQNLPFFRFPLPRNPSPEPLDYEKMRDIFKQAVAGFAKAETTLAGMGQSDVKLPVALGLVRLDLNGDGKAEELETLWRVMDASLGGGNLQPEQAERFIITFDRPTPAGSAAMPICSARFWSSLWRMTARPASMPAHTCCFRAPGFPMKSSISRHAHPIRISILLPSATSSPPFT